MRRAAPIALFALVALIASFLAWDPGPGGASADGPAPPPVATSFVPELGLPATEVVAFGTSPAEAPGEAWAYGYLGEIPPEGEPEQVSRYTLLEHEAGEAGEAWKRVPLKGGPAVQKSDALLSKLGALAGQSTPAGSVALITDAGIFLRDPAGAPSLVPPPISPTLLGEGETLLPSTSALEAPIPYAVYDPSAGKAGIFIAPYGDAPAQDKAPDALGPAVLDYDGAEWTREPIETKGEGEGESVHPLAISCGPTASVPPSVSGENCWLLAEVGAAEKRLVLFRRGPAPSGKEGPGGDEGEKPPKSGDEPGEGEGGKPPGGGGQGPGQPGAEGPGEPGETGEGKDPDEDPGAGEGTGSGGGEGEEPTGERWTPVAIEGGGLLGGQPDPADGEPPPGGIRLTPLAGEAQMLTTTGQGVWVDFQTTGADGTMGSATELVEPIAPSPEAPESSPGARFLHDWCYPTGPGCESSLGAAFPSAYRSFAWPGTSPTDSGQRIITGLPGTSGLPGRAMLKLEGGTFAREMGAGGSPGIAPGGAAFASPESGVVADGVNPDSAADGAGQSQSFTMTAAPPAAQTATEPVPFRRPLYAVALNPEGNGEAIAVGAEGEFARFEPGGGWHQDRIEETNEEEKTGNAGLKGDLHESILGVSWPTSERAYAVGAAGTLWSWTEESGFWEPIFPKGEAPINDVAFSQIDPERGFAVGSPNILRPNSATRWGSDQNKAPAYTPPETPPVYTSVAFAGNEAIATYHQANEAAGTQNGGVVVESGAGWADEPEVEKKIAELPGGPRWPNKAAGLEDGGAIVAGPGFVLKRDAPGAEWKFSAEPLPEAANIAALGAYRDSAGVLRSVVSIDLGSLRRGVTPTAYSGTQEPLPASGYLLRETADGWVDLEHEALPVVADSPAMPRRPEPVLGMAVSPDGESILGVGGQTGVFNTSAEPHPTGYETSAAIRLPASAAVAPDQAAPLIAMSGGPAIAIAGGAACVAPCAERASEDLAPDTLLSRAIFEAREATGSTDLRAFVYTGGRLESGVEGPGYEAELTRLTELFKGASPLPVLTTPNPDLLAGDEAGETLFAKAFSGFGPTEGPTPYYAFKSEPPGAPPLEVIVLDLASGTLGSTQEGWLREQLTAARAAGVPVVVVGSASPVPALPDPPLGVRSPTQVQDPTGLGLVLGDGGAPAYFFEYPGANMGEGIVNSETPLIPAIGTGALGYGKPADGARDWLGSSAFLIAEFSPPSSSGPSMVSSISAIPVIESLTLHGSSGVTLAAGEAEEFEGLGRLPAGGIRVDGTGDAASFAGPEPYLTIIPGSTGAGPCEGANCTSRVVEFEYAFTSSDPEVGDFVNRNSSPDAEGELEPTPFSNYFCAKSPGTTTVSITAGGLTYSEPITVTEDEPKEECRVTELTLLPSPTRPPAVETPASEPAPASPHRPPSKPQPPHVPSPVPAPHHPAPSHPQPNPPATKPTPAPQPPPEAAPTPTPAAPAPQALGPTVSPHPPPAAQPAPPTGTAPASQPVPQPASQPGGQGASAPSVVPAPATAAAQAKEREAALQRQHQAVRVSPAVDSNFFPTGGLIVGSLALLALAGGVGATAARGRSRAYVGAGRRPM